MSVPVLTFFHSKGGFGKTSLVYHLSWMFAEQGMRVLAVDLDPQANLTAAFLDEDQLAPLWGEASGVSTIFRSVQPLLDARDIAPIDFQTLDPRLALIPGDPGLASIEDELSSQWTQALGDRNKARSFLVLTAFWRSVQAAASRFDADLIVFDVGPNLSAINRAALIASDHVIVPVGADLLSLRGLRNLGPALLDWRKGWEERKRAWAPSEFELPVGDMKPLGYVAMRLGVRLTRPVQACTRWLDQVPSEFRHDVLDEDSSSAPILEHDPLCLAMLKNYNSLMPLGQEARKPIFFLKAADGAIGSHATAVAGAYADFKQLAGDIGKRIGLNRLP